jgi:hypothetical protein
MFWWSFLSEFFLGIISIGDIVVTFLSWGKGIVCGNVLVALPLLKNPVFLHLLPEYSD